MQNLKRNWPVVSKFTWGFWRILTWPLKSLRNCTLMGSSWSKYAMFELKDYGEVMFDDTEDWCKIWRKNDLCFPKWHEKFGKFLPEYLKNLKTGSLMGSFFQSRKCMSLKFTEELCVIKMKNDVKLQEGLTCRFKLTWGISWILTQPLKSFKNLHFNGLLLNKIYNVWAKQLQRSYVSWQWRVMQNLTKKLTWGLENYMRNLEEFYQSTRKSQNCKFDDILLSKVKNIWA